MAPITFEDLLNSSVEIEEKSAEFYRTLEELFGRHEEIRAFMAEMAEDEARHVEWVRRVLREISPEKASRTAPKDLIKGNGALENFLASDPTSSVENLDDAYEVTHKLENLEIVPLFRYAAERLIPLKSEDVSFLELVDRHVHKAMQIPKLFGDKIARKAVATV